MSETKKRNVHLAEFKAKVGLEAVRGVMPINEIAQAHGVHPVQVSQWKKEIQEQAKTLFEGKRGPPAGSRPQRPGSAVRRNRASQNGTRLAQKRVRDQPAMMRQTWVDQGDTVAMTWQCALAGVLRATAYARQKPKLIVDNDEMLKRLIDEEYTRHPFDGSRKMVVYLGRCGHTVNRKRAQRLMRTLGLQGMAPGPNTSRALQQVAARESWRNMASYSCVSNRVQLKLYSNLSCL